MGREKDKEESRKLQENRRERLEGIIGWSSRQITGHEFNPYESNV